MQIIEFTSPVINALVIILLWTTIQISVPFICLKIGDKHFRPDSFFFKTHRWENNGDIYNKIFKIKKWKKLLPDGGAVMKSGYKKKHIDTASPENLEKFVIESCRGEFAHWVLILPFWTVGFFAPPMAVVFMLIYALTANLPCIIAQRYNRPRVHKLLEKINRRKK